MACNLQQCNLQFAARPLVICSTMQHPLLLLALRVLSNLPLSYFWLLSPEASFSIMAKKILSVMAILKIVIKKQIPLKWQKVHTHSKRGICSKIW